MKKINEYTKDDIRKSVNKQTGENAGPRHVAKILLNPMTFNSAIANDIKNSVTELYKEAKPNISKVKPQYVNDIKEFVEKTKHYLKKCDEVMVNHGSDKFKYMNPKQYGRIFNETFKSVGFNVAKINNLINSSQHIARDFIGGCIKYILGGVSVKTINKKLNGLNEFDEKLIKLLLSLLVQKVYFADSAKLDTSELPDVDKKDMDKNYWNVGGSHGEDRYGDINEKKTIKQVIINENQLNAIYNFVINEEQLKGGLADNLTIDDLCKKHNVSKETIQKQLDMGVKVEMEHTKDKEKAKEIAMDHIYEDPKYYTKLKKIEN